MSRHKHDRHDGFDLQDTTRMAIGGAIAISALSSLK